MILYLSRGSSGGATATLGRLAAPGLFLYTLELPWRENVKGTSCVPLGRYELHPFRSVVHGPTWCLHNPGLNVWAPNTGAPPAGRTFCELHSANWARQLKGCIALGRSSHPLIDPATGIAEPAVEDSRAAILDLLAALSPMSEGHVLNIEQAPA